jgi:hypothetical protein
VVHPGRAVLGVVGQRHRRCPARSPLGLAFGSNRRDLGSGPGVVRTKEETSPR